MKLLIAIPCYETMRAETARSLCDLIARLHEDHVDHICKEPDWRGRGTI